MCAVALAAAAASWDLPPHGTWGGAGRAQLEAGGCGAGATFEGPAPGNNPWKSRTFRGIIRCTEPVAARAPKSGSNPATFLGGHVDDYETVCESMYHPL